MLPSGIDPESPCPPPVPALPAPPSLPPIPKSASLPIRFWVGIVFQGAAMVYLVYKEELTPAVAVLGFILAQLGVANTATTGTLAALASAAASRHSAYSSDHAAHAAHVAAETSHATRADVQQILDSPAISGIRPGIIEHRG